MAKNGKKTSLPAKKIRQVRIYSEAFKQSKVSDIEKGLIKVRELSKLYGMSPQTVYKWLYKYSVHYKKGSIQVVQMESEQAKTQELLARVQELEAALGRKQLAIDYLEKLISLASSELKVDLKKNFDTKFSSTSTQSGKEGDIV